MKLRFHAMFSLNNAAGQPQANQASIETKIKIRTVHNGIFCDYSGTGDSEYILWSTNMS